MKEQDTKEQDTSDFSFMDDLEEKILSQIDPEELSKTKIEEDRKKSEELRRKSVEDKKKKLAEAQRRRAVSKARKARISRRKRKLLSFFLIVLLLAMFSGIGAFLYMLRGGSFSEFVQPYATAREYPGRVEEKEILRLEPFGEKLCIVEGDVALDGIELPEYEEGLLMDISSRTTLYAQDALARVYPASITKLVTAILALEHGGLDQTVTITDADLDLEWGSQVCGFMPGDKLTMNQLLHCLLVYSGNDAANAIASHVGGSIPAFVDMMNEYARSLGCTGTHFVNPHGLQDENHYTTPYDIYLLLKEAAKYPSFTEISQMPSYTVEYNRADGTRIITYLEATDHYLTGEATLPRNVTVLGGKTGTTNEAGNCLALLSQNAYGKPFVSIILGAWEKGELYEQMNLLLQHIND